MLHGQKSSPLMTVGAACGDESAPTPVPWGCRVRLGMHKEDGAWHNSRTTAERGETLGCWPSALGLSGSEHHALGLTEAIHRRVGAGSRRARSNSHWKKTVLHCESMGVRH